MLLSHIILAILWITYGLLHSLFASLFFKKWMERLMTRQFKIYRLYYIMFAFFAFAGIIFYQVIISSPLLFKTNLFIRVSGSMISITGLVIMIICIHKYFMQLSGLRSLIENRTGNRLMITGIHKYVRHPLYAGTFLFIWGLWIVFPYLSLLISNTIITIYTLTGIRFEEKKLVIEFGESYIAYQRKTPMIIPDLKTSAQQ